jgi:hypothetical protein
MVVMGIFFREHTGLYVVLETVEVDEKSFSNHILELIVEKNIPRLYPGEEHKVTIHMDSSGRHVCSETTFRIKLRGV